MSIAIPFLIGEDGLVRCTDVKQSIDSFLSLLLTTPCHSCTADPEFGFVFSNLRFEIFDENEGVVYHKTDEDPGVENRGLYEKKISGSSKNLNTFAAELKEVVCRYEKRLEDVSVMMTYIRNERRVYVTVKGIIIAGQIKYLYNTSIKVWN